MFYATGSTVYMVESLNFTENHMFELSADCLTTEQV